MSEYTEIGKLLKPHGVKGELKCFIEEEYLEDVLLSRVVYVSQGASAIPYFIESIRSQEPFLIKLETVDNKEDAVEVAHKKLQVPTKILTRIIVEEPDTEYDFAIGWKLVDETQGEVGTITKVEEYPQQDMAFVERDGREILIPMHAELVVNINREDHFILMNLPEGLIDMTEEE